MTDSGRRKRRNNREQTSVPSGYLTVGQIIGPHGIRGEVRVEPFTDFPEERFATGQTLMVGDELQPYQIDGSRPHKNRVLLRLQEIQSREQADELRGEWIFIPESDAVELDDDTYFVHQIVGLGVETTDGTKLGEIKDVLFTGANEVYVVDPLPEVTANRELLIPAIADVVQEVDLAGGRLVVALLPGMLE